MIRAALFLILVLATHAALGLLFTFDLHTMIWSAIAYSAGTLLILYLLFHPRNQWLVNNRSRVECHGGRPVALTFDDGPTPVRTPRLLDILCGLQRWGEFNGRSSTILLTSGFRTAATNGATEGAALNSMHMYGRAADIVLEGPWPGAVAHFIRRLTEQPTMSVTGVRGR